MNQKFKLKLQDSSRSVKRNKLQESSRRVKRHRVQGLQELEESLKCLINGDNKLSVLHYLITFQFDQFMFYL